MASHQKLLAELLKGLEGPSTSVDLCPVFLEGQGKPRVCVCVCVGEECYKHTHSRLSTWCLSSKASAPVTSLASSSEDTSPLIPLIQDIKSLGTDPSLEFEQQHKTHGQEASSHMTPAHLKSDRKRCRSWELTSLSFRWSARPTRLLQAVFSSLHLSLMSSTASGWDWIRRSAVSPRELT